VSAIVEADECIDIPVSDRTLAVWFVRMEHKCWTAYLALAPEADAFEIFYRFSYDSAEAAELAPPYLRCGRLLSREDQPKEYLIERLRSAFNSMCDGNCGWEAIRGARSTEEFRALLMTMPGCEE
jgi:hypothetical protein